MSPAQRDCRFQFFCKVFSQTAECLQFAWGYPWQDTWQDSHDSLTLCRQTGVSVAQRAGTRPQCRGLSHSTPCRPLPLQYQHQTCPQVSQPAVCAWTLCAQGQLPPGPALLNIHQRNHGHSSNWAVTSHIKALLVFSHQDLVSWQQESISRITRIYAIFSFHPTPS